MRKAVLLVLLCLPFIFPPILAGEEKKPPSEIKDNGNETVSMHFSGVELKEVIKVFEKYTGKRFLFDEALVAGKKINLLSSTPLPVDRIIDVFESVLEVEGLALVRSGEGESELMKIVDVRTIQGKDMPTFTAKDLESIPESDRVVTLVYEVKYLQAPEVAKAFKGMTTLPGGVISIGGTSMLRITDYAANVKRIGKMLEEIDVKGPEIVRETVKLSHATPEELVEEIKPLIDIENRVYLSHIQQSMERRFRQILGRRGGPLPSLNMGDEGRMPIAVAAVPRLGSVIVSASKDKIEDIVGLVKSLDIVDPQEKVTKYYTLKYQVPSEVASKLGRIFNVAETVRTRWNRRRRRPQTQTATKKGVTIVADDESGQIVVVASEKTHEEVKLVIERLDVTADDERELRYFPVENADVEAVTHTLAQVFGLEAGTDPRVAQWMRARRRGRGGAAETKGVYAAKNMALADKNLSSVIVIARKEVLDKVGEMVKQLDVEGPGDKEIKYYYLKFANADDVAGTLQSLYSSGRQRWNRRRGGQNEDRSITAVPNAKMSVVIVLASNEVHKEIEEVLKNLDVATAKLELRYYTVEHASLEQVAATVARLFNLQKGTDAQTFRRNWRRRRGANQTTSEEPVVIVDENLSALIVLASADVHDRIAQTLAKIDVEGPGERETRYYKIVHAPVREVAQTLSVIFSKDNARSRSRRWRRRSQPASKGEPVIIPNEEMKTIVAFASREDHDEIKKVIDNLDTETMENVLRFYALKYADLEQVAETISQVFGLQSGSVPAWYRRRGGRGAAKSGTFSENPLVATDENLGAVIVLAPEEVHQRVAEVVKKLDVEGPGERFMKTYRVTNASVSDVADTIRSVFSDSTNRWNRRGRRGRGGAEKGVVVIPSEESGSVVAYASKEDHAEIESIIKTLDVEGLANELAYYRVEHAELESLAQTVAKVFGIPLGDDRRYVQWYRARRRGGSIEQIRSFSKDPLVMAEPNLSSLIVLAPREVHEKIKTMLKDLDVEGPGERLTKYYKIVNASVSEVAATLSAVFADGNAGRRNRWRRSPVTGAEDVVIVENAELSMVVVSASEDKQAEVAEVIKNLDVESVKDNVLRYYSVKNADLDEVADTVSKVFGLTRGDDRRFSSRRRYARRRGGDEQRSPYGDENVVIADHNLGSLIVVAPKEVHDKIGPVLEKVDTLGPGQKEVKYYRVSRSSVTDVARTISSIFNITLESGRGRPRRGAAATGQTTVVIPNESLGCVIVVAPADVQKKIAGVIENLDTTGPDENELKYYKIEKCDLVEAANIVSQIFGIPLGSVENSYRGRKRGDADLLSKERVIIANENLNTLVVVAPREMQKEIADTIARIDAEGPRDNVLRIYDATASDVNTAANTISQLFNIKISTGTPRRTRGRASSSGPKLGTEPFILPDNEVGTIIVNAPEDVHAEIRKVMDKLIELGQQEKMTIRFYKLKNTDSEEVAAKIGQLFNITVGDVASLSKARRKTSRAGSSGRRGRSQAGEEEDEDDKGAAPPGPEVPDLQPLPKSTSGKKEFFFEGESVVIPDKNLNSIILIAPEYIHTEVSNIILKLDVRRPQVLFEVAILDISLDEDLDVGVELTTIDKQGASRPRGHGFTNWDLSERTATAGEGFPDSTKVRTDLQGIFMGITKGAVGNVPLLIRLLQENTNVKIHSTPLLLVNDNEEAEFSSLQEQPTTSTSQGTATTNVSFSGFVEAGTTLKITPHVSEGNYIRVDIDLKVDNFYGEPSAPGIPPPRASNQLKTSITVPDDRTVVIGGLTTNKTTQVESKIPILGDIPILGYLFRSTKDQQVSSRLFLFITPKIMDDIEFRDLDAESKKKSDEVERITGEGIREVAPTDGEKEDR